MNGAASEDSATARPGASTDWTLVLEAAGGDETGAALNRLCQKYWRPIYCAVRARGLSRAEAQDATQDFFADLLEKGAIKNADPKQGRFRAYLMVGRNRCGGTATPARSGPGSSSAAPWPTAMKAAAGPRCRSRIGRPAFKVAVRKGCCLRGAIWA